MNLYVRKRTIWRRLKSAKTDKTVLSVWRSSASLAFQNAPNKDYDQTAQMRRLKQFCGLFFIRVGDSNLRKLTRLLLSVWRSSASLAFQNAPSKDYDQTAQMRRLKHFCGLFFLMFFVRLFDFRLFGFVCVLLLLVSWKVCGLWLWHSLDFFLVFFFCLNLR